MSPVGTRGLTWTLGNAAMTSPVLYSDDRGIWREDRPGCPYGILWSEIYRVTIGKLDGVDEVYTTIEVDFDYGHFIELNALWNGFEGIVDSISKRLKPIDPDWRAKAACLGINDEPLLVWQRPP